MQAIFFALISYVGCGLGDIFGAITARKIGAYSTTLWAPLVGFLIFTVYAPFAIGDLEHASIPIILFSLFLGFFFFAGNLAFNPPTRNSRRLVRSWDAETFSRFSEVYAPTKRI